MPAHQDDRHRTAAQRPRAASPRSLLPPLAAGPTVTSPAPPPFCPCPSCIAVSAPHTAAPYGTHAPPMPMYHHHPMAMMPMPTAAPAYYYPYLPMPQFAQPPPYPCQHQPGVVHAHAFAAAVAAVVPDPQPQRSEGAIVPRRTRRETSPVAMDVNGGDLDDGDCVEEEDKDAAAPEKQSHLVHPHPATAAAITTVYSQLVSELVRDLAAREFAEAKIRQLDILHTYPTSTAVLNNGSGQIISPFATPRSPIAHLAAGFLNLTVRETVRSLARSEIRRAVSDRLHADAAAHVLSNLIAGEVRAIAAEEVRNAQVYARRRGGDALGSHVSEEEGPVDAARQLLKVVMVNALLDPEGNGDAESLAAVMDAIVAGAMLFS